jgi:hypothetical protein
MIPTPNIVSNHVIDYDFAYIQIYTLYIILEEKKAPAIHHLSCNFTNK